MLHIAKRLASMGVMGINRRNAEYILQYNRRRHYPLVDDKLRTKQLALDAGIAIPELYGVVEIEHQIRDLPDFLRKYPDFVLKPAQGTGGEGIEVIVGKMKDLYRRPSGEYIDDTYLKHHVSNILNGLFSLGGHEDKAIIEYRVRFDPVLDEVSYQGVPDIRIIVFMVVPVMSMIRLPTRMSGGKANLHQGAIGVGIDIATGMTLNAVWHNSIVSVHPDTHNPVTGFRIPHWEELLVTAARCYELTGLGYLGVDIVLDRSKGPLMLEMNARPGLNIQIANHAGLYHRLKFVRANASSLGHVMDRVAFSRKMLNRTH